MFEGHVNDNLDSFAVYSPWSCGRLTLNEILSLTHSEYCRDFCSLLRVRPSTDRYGVLLDDLSTLFYLLQCLITLELEYLRASLTLTNLNVHPAMFSGRQLCLH